MTRFPRLFVTALGILLAPIALSCSDEPRQGKATTHADGDVASVIDLGTLRAPAKKDFKLSIKAPEGADIEIKNIKTSCTCAVSKEKVLGKILRPAETLVVPVSYQTQGKVGEISDGIYVIYTANGVDRYLKFLVKAHVLSRIGLSPETLLFGNCVYGKKAVGSILVRGGGRPDFSIDIKHTPYPIEDVEIERKVDFWSNPVYYLKCTTKTLAKDSAPFETSLDISTNDPDQPDIAIPIKLSFAEPFLISPSALNFGEIDPTNLGVVVARDVVVEAVSPEHNASTIRIEAPGYIKIATVSGDAKKARYRVELDPSKIPARGLVTSNVAFSSHEYQSALRIVAYVPANPSPPRKE
jgi:hypothetical protein